MLPKPRGLSRTLTLVVPLLLLAGCGTPPASTGGVAPGALAAAVSPATGAGAAGRVDPAQVLRGRTLVINHDCGACHGGGADPAAEGWLAGAAREDQADSVGPFRVWARNLTPDPETGLGRYTERQIFNAIRYGLRPAETPDIEITSAVPGEGNHPASPRYLSPAMPWAFFRYMTDDELRAVAAYLKHGVRPVVQRVPDSQAPPDFWAEASAPAAIGPPALPPFPAAREGAPPAERRDEVLRGRQLVAGLGCAACHGGALHPGQEAWLQGSWPGMVPALREFDIGPFRTYPRNLTPDNSTGIGRFSERQIFNALRYGLRPGETPDVEITSTTPGEGNHPANPKYLAPPMPWPAYRHLPDDAIRAIAAYLKHGVRPATNRVLDSDGPPDFWASEYTEGKMGTMPTPAFPTARERAVR